MEWVGCIDDPPHLGRPEQGGKQKRARQEEEGGNVMETQRHRMVLRTSVRLVL